MKNKYTKIASTYADDLYDTGIETYSLADYKKRIAEHLAKLDQLVIEFEKSHPGVEDIKIRITLEPDDYNHVDYNTRLTGDMPMSEKERAAVDKSERVRTENVERVERQQLEALLKKYKSK